MRALILVVALLASACTMTDPLALSVEQQAYVACRAIPPTVRSINTLDPARNTRIRLALAMDSARPICESVRRGEPTTESTLRAIRDQLRVLLLMERDLRNG